MSKKKAECGMTETFNAEIRDKNISVRTGFLLFDRRDARCKKVNYTLRALLEGTATLISRNRDKH